MSAPDNSHYSASVDRSRRGLAGQDFGVEQFGEERPFHRQGTRNVRRRRSRLPFILVMTAVIAFIITQAVPAWRASNGRIPAVSEPQISMTNPTTDVKLATVDSSRSIPASLPKPAEVSTTRPSGPALRTTDAPIHTATGEAIPLGLTMEGSTDGLVVIVSGMPAGSNLSVGRPVGPTEWQLPAKDLARVLIRPPAGFAGAVEVTVDLQGADDRILDRRWRRLEWRSARPLVAAQADPRVATVNETNAIAGSVATPPKPSPTIKSANARTTSDPVSRPSLPPAKGSYVQVSSQRSELDAQSTFKELQRKFPDTLGNRQATIRRAELGDKTVYYRVMIGPLGIEQANELCSSLRASGGQCLVQQN